MSSSVRRALDAWASRTSLLDGGRKRNKDGWTTLGWMNDPWAPPEGHADESLQDKDRSQARARRGRRHDRVLRRPPRGRQAREGVLARKARLRAGGVFRLLHLERRRRLTRPVDDARRQARLHGHGE